MLFYILSRGQSVRQRTLTPLIVGSNPTGSAIKYRYARRTISGAPQYEDWLDKKGADKGDNMLEWLKNILADNYTEDIDKQISQEIGKNFVSKADFNAKSEALKATEKAVKDRDTQLESLKASSGNAEELKSQIATLQTQNAEAKKNYEAELARIRLDGAVETALTAAGAKNNTAVKALLADFLKDAKLDDSGAVKGLTAEIDALAKADATAFLFNAADGNNQQQFKGMQPGSAGGSTPPPNKKEPKDMSYEELSAYLDANPGAKLD